MDSVLPCGMPCVRVCVSVCACCVCVDCSLFLKYDAKNSTASGVKLKSFRSLWSSFSCEIVSYAFDRSM